MRRGGPLQKEQCILGRPLSFQMHFPCGRAPGCWERKKRSNLPVAGEWITAPEQRWVGRHLCPTVRTAFTGTANVAWWRRRGPLGLSMPLVHRKGSGHIHLARMLEEAGDLVKHR